MTRKDKIDTIRHQLKLLMQALTTFSAWEKKEQANLDKLQALSIWVSPTLSANVGYSLLDGPEAQLYQTALAETKKRLSMVMDYELDKTEKALSQLIENVYHRWADVEMPRNPNRKTSTISQLESLDKLNREKKTN